MTVSLDKIQHSYVETEQEKLLANADNLRERIKSLPDVDNVAATLIDETRESHEQGSASELDEITADVVGAELILENNGSPKAAAALDREPIEILGETLEIIGLSRGSDAVEEIIVHIEAGLTDSVDPSYHKVVNDLSLQHGLSGQISIISHLDNFDANEQDVKDVGIIQQLIDTRDVLGISDHMSKNEITVDEASLLLKNFGDLIIRSKNAWKSWGDDSYESISAEENAVISKLIYKIEHPRNEAGVVLIEQYINVCNSESVSPQLNLNEISAAEPDVGKKVTDLLYEKKMYADLIRNSEELDEDQQKIIDKLVELGEFEAVIHSMYYLDSKLDYTKLYDSLVENKKFSVIFSYKEFFPTLDIQFIYNEIKNDPDQLDLIARNSELLSLVPDRTEFLMQCIDEHWISVLEKEGIFADADIGRIIDKLESNDAFDSIITLAIRNPEFGIDYASYYDQCADKRPYSLLIMFGEGEIAIDSEKIYGLLLENGYEAMILKYAEKFTPEQCASAVDASLKPGGIYHVLSNLDNAQLLASLDTKSYLKDALRAGCFEDVQRCREYIPGISDEFIVELLIEVGRSHEALGLVKNEGSEDLKDKVHQDIIQVIETGSFHGEIGFSRINDYVQDNFTSSDIPESLKLANRFMSAGATLAGFNIIKKLSEGELPVSAQEIGVSDTGIKGLEQFGARCREMVSNLLAVEINDALIADLEKSELYMSVLAKVYRVDVAEFGGVTEEGVQFSLERFRELKGDGMIEQLAEGYDVLSTDVMTLERSRSQEIAIDAQDRYGVLRADILEAVGMFDENHAIARQVEELAAKLETIRGKLFELSSGLEFVDKDDKKTYFTVKNARDKLNKLEQIIDEVKQGAHIGENFALRSPESMSRVFESLSNFGELDADMRKLIFSWAVRNDPVKRDQLLHLPEKPTIDDLSTVRSFIEQTVNQETFGNYFSDKKLATKFRKITSVKALDDALIRHQQVSGSEATRAFTLLPTRGFAMELSGQVSDACWAGQYESIAAEFPNLTSVIMKRGEKGSKDERLVGAMVMIETTNDKGEGVLVMRGINPIENFINKVRVEDFYRICTEYCRDTAAKRGLKPAIVISEQSGQSGTNRPVLQDFMEKVRGGMQKIRVNPEDSTFNGYDISDLAYAL